MLIMSFVKLEHIKKKKKWKIRAKYKYCVYGMCIKNGVRIFSW